MTNLRVVQPALDSVESMFKRRIASLRFKGESHLSIQ
jgi:hypothetical protein